MRLYALLFFTLMLLFAASCKIKCNQYPGFGVYYKGFSDSETSVVVMAEYKKGTDFGELTAVYSTDSIYKYNNNDTGNLYDKSVLDNNHDYIYYLPIPKRTYKIRDITYQQLSGAYPGSDWNCVNAATWYVNDSLQKFDGLPPTKHGQTRGATIYLIK